MLRQIPRRGCHHNYKWHSYADLSRQLGKSKGYVCMTMSRHPSWGIKELLDIQSKPVYECCGLTYSTETELSIKLGKRKAYIKDQKRNNPWLTLEEIVSSTLKANAP